MADPVTTPRETWGLRPFLQKMGLALGLVIVGPTLAMPDPTLPPPALRASSPAAAAETPQMPRRLQGVRPGIDAVIDGHVRRVGERWLGHELLRVETHTAVLRQPDGRLLRLSLWPTAKPSEPS